MAQPLAPVASWMLSASAASPCLSCLSFPLLAPLGPWWHQIPTPLSLDTKDLESPARGS